MKALVLEKTRHLSLRDIDLPLDLGPDDVKIAIETVGICGSDVHYYTHGRIGPYIVEKPMVLGHEASGRVIEVGANVHNLKSGDRVCMEPGVANDRSRATRLGLYNLDPDVVFWATPPVHGCLTPFVVHPANLTFKLPDNVSFAEGAMIEPFAVGMQAVIKARVTPGDVALVIGAGPIGIMVALAALAGGCSTVIISDIQDPKLLIAARYDGIVAVNSRHEDLGGVVDRHTGNWVSISSLKQVAIQVRLMGFLALFVLAALLYSLACRSNRFIWTLCQPNRRRCGSKRCSAMPMFMIAHWH
jgi:D-xylulose reductase